MEKNNIIVLTNKKLKKCCSIFKSKDELLRFFDGWLKCNDLDQNVRLKDLHEKTIISESTVSRLKREHLVLVVNLSKAIDLLVEDYGYENPYEIQEQLNEVVKRIRVGRTAEEEARRFGVSKKYVQDNSFRVMRDPVKLREANLLPEAQKLEATGKIPILLFWNDRLKKT